AVIKSQAKRFEPRDVFGRQVAQVAHAVARKRRAAAVVEPLQEIVSGDGGKQKLFVIAEETHHIAVLAPLKHPDGLNHSPAVRATIDVIADKDEPVRNSPRIATASCQNIGERAAASVDVADR